MKQRCYNPNYKQYKDYGGRGIAMCPQWLHDFSQFERDMSPRPPNALIDRINNDGDYSPENCRWVTARESQRNRRDTRMVTIEGKTYAAADLADHCNYKTDSIVARAAAGLTLIEVMFGPKRKTGTPTAAIAARIASSQSRTHCRNGHKFTKTNTIWTREGWRRCRACQQAKIARRYTTGYLSR